MASLRDIRRRITSVKNTRKITRAMKLVAGAKLRKATEAAIAARPYQETLLRVLQQVVAVEDSIEHPMLTVPQNSSDVLFAVITSDRGLCGGFNAQLLRFAMQQIEGLKAEGMNVHLLVYGKKAQGFFKSKKLEAESNTGASPETFSEISHGLSDELVAKLNANKFSKAVLCYNRFQSVMTQEPTLSQLLPMKLEETGEEGAGGDFIYEPDGSEILGELLPMVLRAQLLQAFLENEAGEQAARMQAMDNATRNAGELIDKLTLQYNRARQASITSELIEIISGAEAL
jgi:F-type H+-transporting ATPase subunit gamma